MELIYHTAWISNVAMRLSSRHHVVKGKSLSNLFLSLDIWVQIIHF